nr:hypothetical protein [Candidatus Sigynarchaeota archaeon]
MGKLRFCPGCFVSVPVGFTIIMVLFFLHLTVYTNITTFLVIGFVTIAFYVILSLAFHKKHCIKIFSKALLGICLGIFTSSIIALPIGIPEKGYYAYLILSVSIGIMNSKRALEMYIVCKRCKFHFDFDHCPGMSRVMDAIYLRSHAKANSIPDSTAKSNTT